MIVVAERPDREQFHYEDFNYGKSRENIVKKTANHREKSCGQRGWPGRDPARQGIPGVLGANSRSARSWSMAGWPQTSNHPTDPRRATVCDDTRTTRRYSGGLACRLAGHRAILNVDTVFAVRSGNVLMPTMAGPVPTMGRQSVFVSKSSYRDQIFGRTPGSGLGAEGQRHAARNRARLSIPPVGTFLPGVRSNVRRQSRRTPFVEESGSHVRHTNVACSRQRRIARVSVALG